MITHSLRANLVKSITEDAKPSSEHFRISSTGTCFRSLVGKRAGLTPTRPPGDAARLKMFFGSALHEAIGKHLNKEPIVEGSLEMTVARGNWVGHVDAVINLPVGQAVLELKTCHDDAIKYPDIPENYLWQGFHYAMCLNLKHLMVFQVGRSYGLTREVIKPLTQEWIDKIELYTVEAAWHWTNYQKKKELPPCKHRFKWEDKTCPFGEKKAETKEFNPFKQTPDEKEVSDWLDQTHAEEKKK